jgi:hypothetical protein
MDMLLGPTWRVEKPTGNPPDYDHDHRRFPQLPLECTACRNHWTSRGFPLCFRFRQDKPTGQVLLQAYWLLFRQRCKICPAGQAPVWPTVGPAQLTKAADVIRNCWEEQPNGSNGAGLRRTKDPEFLSHRRDLCEGCSMQVCRFSGTGKTA